MNTTAIKNFAQRARRDFRKLVTDKAHALGIGKKEIAKATEHGDALIIHGQAFPLSIKRQWDELIGIVRQQGFDHVIDAMAYTLFNRLCALRFMEVHDYLPQRVLSAKDGGDVPDILRNATDVADKLFTDPKARAEIKELKLAGTQDQELYRRLILAQCNALAPAMPFLFEKPQDYSELLMPDNLLHSDSVVRNMVTAIDEADWQEIEIIGWLYQFYISERKDEVIGKVVEKDDIPAATQLFTPKWIVRYMVENSLGRLWLESHPDSPLKAKMPYFIENPDDGKTPPAKRYDTPDEIKCMDDACGSGHILVYKFDLLYEMYAECGYPKTEIPALILKNNLYGLDIDERAVQLASFALTMKAREKDARFLEKGVFPNVIAIQESNGLDLDAMLNMGVRDTSDRSPFDDPSGMFADRGLLPVNKSVSKQSCVDARQFLADFQPLIALFHDAKYTGSLTTVPATLAARLDALRSLLTRRQETPQLFGRMAVRWLDALIAQAEVLCAKFDVCATNPPYMGSKAFSTALKSFVDNNYRSCKSDLYGCFILRNLGFIRLHGYCALITIPNWMFLGSFEGIRRHILAEATIASLVHNGRGVWGSDFGSCAFVLHLSENEERRGVYRRLFKKQGEVQSNSELEANFFNVESFPKYCADGKGFSRIPGSPVAYWVSETAVKLFSSERVEAWTISEGQNKTSNNERFVRNIWEVSALTIGKRKKWLQYAKGGEFRKWYGNREHVVDWSESARDHYRKDASCRIVPEHLWYRPGITWTLLTAAKQSFRLLDDNETFDMTGSSVFVKTEYSLEYLLAFLNSNVAALLVSILNPTVALQIRNVRDLPIIEMQRRAVIAASAHMIEQAKADWDSYEISLDFAGLPLLSHDPQSRSLSDVYATLVDCLAEKTLGMQRLEEENNRRFIETYGLQNELGPAVPLEDITLTCNPRYRYGSGRADSEYRRLQRMDAVKELISYAIGCMMGRYSFDTPGLQFAGGEWDESMFKGAKFKPDPDGILPVLNDAYFEDDPTGRLAEFLTGIFGKETLNENLQFIARTLGMKGNEASRETIRRYLAEGFFKDHLKTYKKRPIYWLFSSGKERAFQALVYMHRYTPATLSRMRTEYLHELQNKLNARVDEVQHGIEDATSTAQTNRLNREVIRLKRQQAELLAFDEKLNNLAGKKIAIDLDDGVKHNYGLFDDLLAEVKSVCGKDEA